MADGGQVIQSFGMLPRLPPSNLQAEQAFLGALLMNNKIMDRVTFLKVEHFADPVHGQIFRRCAQLIEAGRIADAVTLKADFDNTAILDDVGGPAYLTQLYSAMVSFAGAGDYAKVIRDTWLRRQFIDIAEQFADDMFGADPACDAITTALRTINQIDDLASGTGAMSSFTTLDTAMDAAITAMELAQTTGQTPGTSTGFPSLDYRWGGLEPGLVYVIGGRPGMGKSGIGHQICINAARAGAGVLELSLEMSAMQLGRRALATASRVPLTGIKTGRLSVADADRLVRARKEMAGLPLSIDDAGGQTPRMIAAKVRAAKRKHGISVMMLDHLNLTKADDGDSKFGDTQNIGKAADMMLQIAKDEGVAALLLCQLNRGVEGRDDKRPTLSDLRQSGNIEQNAYAVTLMYREEYYLPGEPEQKEGETTDKFAARKSGWLERKDLSAGKADAITVKVRDGETGTDPLLFHGATTTFSEPPNMNGQPPADRWGDDQNGGARY